MIAETSRLHSESALHFQSLTFCNVLCNSAIPHKSPLQVLPPVLLVIQEVCNTFSQA